MRRALLALPIYFESETHIEGVDVGDLFALNSLLGGTIEGQVVATLNGMRSVWDPDERYADYWFRRHSQSFPDVRLVSETADHPELGIELKGWYVLAREGVPSFRYKVTPAACADHDLLVVVPWYLKNILSGPPVALRPWIGSARHAAEFRNHWWQHVRRASSDVTINAPAAGVGSYPAAGAEISDHPASDGGGNFGRIARIGLLDDYIDEMLVEPLAGVEAGAWLRFARLHAEGYDAAKVAQQLDSQLETLTEELVGQRAARVRELLQELLQLLGQVDH